VEQDDATLTRLLEALMVHAPDVFVCMSAREEDAGMVQYISPSVKNVLGLEPEALVGQYALEFAHPDDAERLGNTLRALFSSSSGSSEVMNSMHRSRTPDGHRWVHVHLWRDEGWLLCVARDASRYASAQAASREYLLSTSHDLRTPCHAIATAGQLLAAREAVAADPEAAFLVDAVCSGCTLLQVLISNVLDMRFGDDSSTRCASAPGAISSEAAARAAHEMRLNLKPVSCSPRALIAGVLRTCRIGCGLLRGRLEWINEAAPLPRRVCADVDRLARVLQNIVLYSLNNSPGDAALQLEVTYEQLADSTNAAGALRVSVCDPDRQLWTEQCARIFTPRVAGRSAEPDMLGSSCGLGLFVARTLARAMGGDVYAECVGSCGGSVIIARLPVGLPPDACLDDTDSDAAGEALADASPSAAHLAASSAAYAQSASDAAKRRRLGASSPPPQEAGPAQRPARCLLVDDHLLNIKLVQRLLEHNGFEVRVARAIRCFACAHWGGLRAGDHRHERTRGAAVAAS
jgi:signal transduction histidine kinase